MVGGWTWFCGAVVMGLRTSWCSDPCSASGPTSWKVVSSDRHWEMAGGNPVLPLMSFSRGRTWDVKPVRNRCLSKIPLQNSKENYCFIIFVIYHFYLYCHLENSKFLPYVSKFIVNRCTTFYFYFFSLYINRVWWSANQGPETCHASYSPNSDVLS